MLCEECGKKQASLHFTKIINGNKTEFHLCDSCAQEKGELAAGMSSGFSIHNLLSGLLEFDPQSNGIIESAPGAVRCDTCGLTYAQFSKIGRFGCSGCYKTFSERLSPMLKRVHGNTVHTGKIPKRAGGKIKHRRKIDELKRQLQLSISNEEFEEAAKLRDEIRELEQASDNV